MNIIYGNNAQGKTNLLEAVSLLSTGRSFRTAQLSDLICEGNSFFYIEAEIVRDDVTQTVKIYFDKTSKKLQLNATEYPLFSPLLGMFPSILLSPEDPDLVDSSPALRRKFLNLHLAQGDPLYVHHYFRFWRAMKQRNCLLKMRSLETLDIWETQMAQSAEYLFQSRRQFLGDLKGILEDQSKKLTSGAEVAEIRFLSTYPPEMASYSQLLKKMRNREKEIGQTLQGPHRDDLAFHINEKPAKSFASEGQKKTVAAALRFAEWQLLEKKTGAKPFMIIDDFEGTLDLQRQRHFSDFLKNLGQVFVATPLAPKIFQNACRLYIEAGKIEMEPQG